MKVDISRLERALRMCWDETTCTPQERNYWSPRRPSGYQSDATSLVVQDYLGGRIAINHYTNHHWNVLPHGGQIDFAPVPYLKTASLFYNELVYKGELMGRTKSTQEVLGERYLTLRERVKNFMGMNEQFLYMGLFDGKTTLEKKYALVYKGKGEQLNYGYSFNDHSPLEWRTFTKTLQGLFIGWGDDLTQESFSEEVLKKSSCITRNPVIAQELYDRIWKLPLHSPGSSLHHIMTR